MIEYLVEIFFKKERFNVVTFNDYESFDNYIRNLDLMIFLEEKSNGCSNWSYLRYQCEEVV